MIGSTTGDAGADSAPWVKESSIWADELASLALKSRSERLTVSSMAEVWAFSKDEDGISPFLGGKDDAYAGEPAKNSDNDEHDDAFLCELLGESFENRFWRRAESGAERALSAPRLSDGRDRCPGEPTGLARLFDALDALDALLKRFTGDKERIR